MSDIALKIIQDHSQNGAKLREQFFSLNKEKIDRSAIHMAASLASDGKILICGNGGSAADSQHLAAEFINRFLMERPALPAIALTTDTSSITAIGNDREFNEIFSRQIEALGNKNDILIAISTSGHSKNIITACSTAKKKNLFVIGLTGKDPSQMESFCDILLNVDDNSTPLIQEIHITVEHLLCQLTDYYLFENVLAIEPYLKNKGIENAHI